MTVKLIVAVDQAGAIGWSDGRLPWRLKSDMKRFKELTTSHIVVMGFNTFKSLNMPKGLPNRKNVVLTRKPWSEAREHIDTNSDIDVISSVDYIHRLEKTLPDQITAPRDIWIIGGASVYEEALQKDIVDEMYVTLVHTATEADIRLTTDVVAWKRFVLVERSNGRNWEPTIISRQWDGDIETTYLHLQRNG